MNTYHINKGIGKTVEFKGLKAQYLLFSQEACWGIDLCNDYVYGWAQYLSLPDSWRSQQWNSHLADLLTECKIRGTWLDEIGCTQKASKIRHQSKEYLQVFEN